MGYIRHEAILLTSWDEKRLNQAREKALEIFREAKHVWGDITCLVSPLIESMINGYVTFLIAPDGSKEGWSESDKAEAARTAFIEWLKGPGADLHIDWVLIAYGGDTDAPVVEAHSDEEEGE